MPHPAAIIGNSIKKYKKSCLVFSIENYVSIELLRQAKFINIKKLEKFIRK